MLKTVTRALQVLQVLGDNPDGMTLTTIASAVGTNKQDAFRLVKALAAFRFVANDAQSGKIVLGGGILHLAGKIKVQIDLQQVSQVPLTKLRDQTGETACLHVRASDKRVCIFQVESLDELRCVSNIGQGLPLTIGAPGRVFLAFMSENDRRQILSDAKRLPNGTTIDHARLNRLLDQLRRDGYTIARNETVPGMAAVAAPIFGHSGAVVAAMTVLGPSHRLTQKRLLEHAVPLREAAQHVSKALQMG